MLVSELKAKVEERVEHATATTLGNIEIPSDASVIRLKDSGEQFPLDFHAERALAGYLSISKSYLTRCPNDLKAHNFNYWLQRRPDAPAVIESFDNVVVSVHKPGLLVLPLDKVTDIITRVFDPNHEVINFVRDTDTFHLDIKTDHHVEVKPDKRIEGREVGDITHGGVRFLLNPTEVKPPQVLTYLHRLYCTNGSCSAIAEGTIALKGHTVDTLLAQLELAAQRVLGELDAKLADYAALATVRPPGDLLQFVWQLCREYGLGQRLMDRITERARELPADASLYDIQQLFTQLANANVNYKNATKLQHLGGDIAFNTHHIVHRCSSCERLLPE